MDKKDFFYEHYKRLLIEGILKSILIGVVACFTINFISAFIYWMLEWGALWIGAVAGVAVGALTGVLVYRFRYKPNKKEVMQRLDSYGLEERMITMLELEGDESYIAKLQRKDAEEALASLPPENVGLSISRPSIVLASVITALSIAFITLGGLAEADIIPYGKEALGIFGSGEFEVRYLQAEGGELIGDLTQSVHPGESTSKVFAKPADGWIFVGWDDGFDLPERYERNVSSDLVIKAVFARINTSELDPEDESDGADDMPNITTKEESGGGSDDPGGDTPSSGGQEGSGGGKWQDKNQFIDGATYYRDYLDLYYQYATDIFESNGEIPKDIIEFFEIYFSGI